MSEEMSGAMTALTQSLEGQARPPPVTMVPGHMIKTDQKCNQDIGETSGEGEWLHAQAEATLDPLSTWPEYRGVMFSTALESMKQE